jgi:hypothetical protein
LSRRRIGDLFVLDRDRFDCRAHRLLGFFPEWPGTLPSTKLAIASIVASSATPRGLMWF